MSTRLTVHCLVERDLRMAVAYYEAEGGIRLSQRFMADVDATIHRLRENPRRFHFLETGLRRAQLGTFPYHFLYEEDGEDVRVLVLRHDRRHPKFGLGRR